MRPPDNLAAGDQPGRDLERLPPVERLQVVDIQPGDYIIATVTDDHTPPDEVNALHELLRRGFPDQHVLIVNGIELDAMRPVHTAEETTDAS